MSDATTSSPPGLTPEGKHFDRKSLRTIHGAHADFPAIARDCVCFANGVGGVLHIGIEDDVATPPPGQRIPAGLLDRLVKRIGELTVNVQVAPEVCRDANGGEYVALRVMRSPGVASTSDGRYFLRVGDSCLPVTGDDVLRLANERPGMPWETMTTLGIPRAARDPSKHAALAAALRASSRVKASVKEKTDEELLDHYHLADGPVLTNLGVLLLGVAADRAKLGTAPVVQAIRYDARRTKIAKQSWDDHTLSPIELLDAVWHDVTDFRESYELPDGMLRTPVPAFDEAVVRELLVNALVHRPYTQRGDIFLKLHPDRLEIVNPGPLPLGVTPQNVLHTTVRRNEHLARLFHDLKLMEREGSGFDKIFEILLSQGRPAPELIETHDRVQVTVRRRILKPEVIDFIAKADQTYQLTQRERIALGLLAQHDALTARELTAALELASVDALPPWIKRLLEWELVQSAGRTQATRYFIDPGLLRSLNFTGETTLKRIEPHRLAALVFEDLQRYPESAISDIHQRIGGEIHPRQVKRALEELIERGAVRFEGDNRWRRYWAVA
jgi:ATP-dependent DNA helicase RecG